jgi:hypothetical protein
VRERESKRKWDSGSEGARGKVVRERVWKTWFIVCVLEYEIVVVYVLLCTYCVNTVYVLLCTCCVRTLYGGLLFSPTKLNRSSGK